MTSKRCYVYLQLPDSLDVVTCGQYERETLASGTAIGRFVYGRRYRSRADAVPLDPIGLPLTDRVVETAKLRGVPGALRDAAPDAWGRLVIDRNMQRTDLDELDYLLHGREDRFGALSFGDTQEAPPPPTAQNSMLQLADLRDAARRVEAGEDPSTLSATLQEVITPGTSLGGARPKASVEDDDGLWIAKFPSRDDRWNNAVIEGGMLRLAARAGIQTPPLRVETLGNESILLVKRFDRHKVARGYNRHRALSGLTMLDAEEEITDRSRWSYLLLADELQRRSEQAQLDKVELFRRMVFNALISNRDDHPRNHAIIAPGLGWRLAPAFDLTPHPSTNQQRDLALAGGTLGRRATRQNLVSAVGRFGLTDRDGESVIDAMKGIVAANWEADVKRLGATKQDCDAVRTSFVYEGFEYRVTE